MWLGGELEWLFVTVGACRLKHSLVLHELFVLNYAASGVQSCVPAWGEDSAVRTWLCLQFNENCNQQNKNVLFWGTVYLLELHLFEFGLRAH